MKKWLRYWKLSFAQKVRGYLIGMPEDEFKALLADVVFYRTCAKNLRFDEISKRIELPVPKNGPLRFS